MSNKELRLSHARNNEAASKALLNTGKFNDWVITTSFYSCLHYLCYDFFPISVEKDGQTISLNSIEHYIQHYSIDKSRHRTLCDLAMAKNPEAAVEYNFLMDLCMQARYRNYQFKDKTVTKALASVIRFKSYMNIPEEESKPQQ